MTSFLTADNLQHPKASHGFFTREGGVSEGSFASLNTGYGSGDQTEKVGENRKRVANALGAEGGEIITCYQVHSSEVHQVNAFDRGKLEGDALVTNTPGLAIGILTADCVPVLFVDSEAGVIAAAHAGWRGAVKGIVEQTLMTMERLGAEKSRIRAAVGPCIAKASYEVGPDVHAEFATKNPDFSDCFELKADGLRYWFDVGGAVEMILALSGVANITRLSYDTYAEEDRFFSFRRSTHRKETVYGRQISAIMLKK